MAKTLIKSPKHSVYSAHEVIEFRDDDHSLYNKRGGYESQLAVQVRAPIASDWVNFNVEETTTTKNYGDKPDRTQSRTISFTMTREMFAAVVAHVNRKKD